ncbi:MAG: sulfotransferase-like domain-containing protein [bacterium]
MTRFIAMWSGPRNISTTMMRSFTARGDCRAMDEPFYAYYLAHTDIDHPMKEAVLASQSQSWQSVVSSLTKEIDKDILFQKHMCQHMLAEIDLDFVARLENFFLIRNPIQMVASFHDRMGFATPEVLGLPREVEIFRHVKTVTGRSPIVVDATDILRQPAKMLETLCDALNLTFTTDMLHWRAGAHEDDGVWGAHWYKAVESSTGFRPLHEKLPDLPPELQSVARQCQPYYEELAAHKITPDLL